MKRLLITGASGTLGRSLSRLAEDRFEVWSAYYSHNTVGGGEPVCIDLRDRTDTLRLAERIKPDIIIHAAASDRSPDMVNTNQLAAANVLDAAAQMHARLVAVSTDLVFDGSKPIYRETDPPAPVSPYGRVKTENERLFVRYQFALVVRTSLIYNTDRDGDQVRWMKRYIEAGNKVPLFTDEIRQPIDADDLAEALLDLAVRTNSGLLHIAGPERLSRWSFGCLLLKWLGFDPTDVAQPVSAALVAPERPRDCSLNLTMASRILNTRIRPVQEVLGLSPESSQV